MAKRRNRIRGRRTAELKEAVANYRVDLLERGWGSGEMRRRARAADDLLTVGGNIRAGQVGVLQVRRYFDVISRDPAEMAVTLAAFFEFCRDVGYFGIEHDPLAEAIVEMSAAAGGSTPPWVAVLAEPLALVPPPPPKERKKRVPAVKRCDRCDSAEDIVIATLSSVADGRTATFWACGRCQELGMGWWLSQIPEGQTKGRGVVVMDADARHALLEGRQRH